MKLLAKYYVEICYSNWLYCYKFKLPLHLFPSTEKSCLHVHLSAVQCELRSAHWEGWVHDTPVAPVKDS